MRVSNLLPLSLLRHQVLHPRPEGSSLRAVGPQQHGASHVSGLLRALRCMCAPAVEGLACSAGVQVGQCSAQCGSVVSISSHPCKGLQWETTGLQ